MPFASELKRLAGQLLSPAQALRLRYKYFKSLLKADDKALEYIADLQEAFYGIRPMDRVRIKELIVGLNQAVQDMAVNLQSMRPFRYKALDNQLASIEKQVQTLILSPQIKSCPPYLISLDQAGSNFELAGGKAANLGQLVKKFTVPPGEVVTTNAFQFFIEHNQLRPRLNKILTKIRLCKYSEFPKHCQNMQEMILQADIPFEISEVLHLAVQKLNKYSSDSGFAVRSSAWAEDGDFSFAGQYQSMLEVQPQNIEQAWLQVIASKYSPRSVTYRILRGMSDEQTPMAVLILPMLTPRVAGVAYSLDHEHEQEVVSIHAVAGLGESLVDGSLAGEAFNCSRKEPYNLVDGPANPSTLNQAEASHIASLAVKLEKFFKSVQDVEWCLDKNGKLHILQSRCFHEESMPANGFSDLEEQAEPRVDGMDSVSKGAGYGRIMYLHDAQDPAEAPRGSVVVFESLAPSLTRCLDRVEAVIGMSGGRAGHFATVAREFGIPVVVGEPQLVSTLEEGDMVTVDGFNGRVYSGRLESLLQNTETVRKQNKEIFKKGYAAFPPLLTNLNLTDPEHENFTIPSCRSMHDLIRYMHEKSVCEMFELVGKSGRGMSRSRKLKTDLPLSIYILPLDRLYPGARQKDIAIEDIHSLPMRMLWQGLSTEEVRWEKGLHHIDWEEMDRVSAGIFSKDARFLSSYALVASDYVHIMIRFGYHFSVLDSICTEEEKNNYVRFKFQGGGAGIDGQRLRLQFLERILRAWGFSVTVRGDMLDALLSRKSGEITQKALQLIGRLLAKTRMMDMYLNDSNQVEEMAEQFISRFDTSSLRGQHD